MTPIGDSDEGGGMGFTVTRVAGRRVARPLAVALLTFASLVALPGTAFAATLVVDDPTDAPDSVRDGICDANGADTCTLRAAVQTANELWSDFETANTITLPAGIYNLDEPPNQFGDDEDAANGDLDVHGSLSINGAGAATTIIDAQGIGARAFSVLGAGATFSIDSVTIQNGDAYDGEPGGAVYSQDPEQTVGVSNSVLKHHGLDSGNDPYECYTSPGEYTICDYRGDRNESEATCVDYTPEFEAQGSVDRCQYDTVMGSAIYIAGSGSDLVLDSTDIIENDDDFRRSCPSSSYDCYPSGQHGGAVASSAPGITVTVTNGSISRNGGAGITYDGNYQNPRTTGSLDISGTEVIGNVSDWQGGGINWDAAWFGEVPVTTVSIADAVITGNLGGVGGGVNIVHRGPTTISGTTIDHNQTTAGQGGGIHHRGTSLDISYSTINDNVAKGGGGGGISNSGNLTITDSSVDGNETGAPTANQGWGGGLYTEEGELHIVDSSLRNNSAHGGRAGGIFFYKGYYDPHYASSIIRSVIDNNSGDQGGGLYADGGTWDISRSSISGNTAASGHGGGVHAGGGAELAITNSTIAANAASTKGGGVYGRNVHLENVTVAHNAAADGGGVYDEDEQTEQETPVPTFSAEDTIIAENTASEATAGDNCGGAFDPVETGDNIDDDGSCGFRTVTDAGLAPARAANGGRTPTIALELSSPAIDAAGACPPPIVDQRGITRPADGDGNGSAICDLGAYELQAAAPPDGDSDSVPDSIDQCPNSAGPATNDGCPVQQQPVGGGGSGGGQNPLPTASPDPAPTPNQSASPGPATSLPECEQDPEAVCGTAGNDELVIDASSDPDGDGVVTVYLGSGDDFVCVEQSSGVTVIVYGQDGNDRVVVRDCTALTGSRALSQQGSPRTASGGGATVVDFLGGLGDDKFLGSAASDTFRGGLGLDQASGRGGDDILRGGPKDDVLRGGSGSDLVAGGLGSDELRGGAGDDTLRGGPQPDNIYGGPGRDILNGGGGRDSCTGPGDRRTRCE